MSASAARVEANRRNAAKSTGPKSPEGKAASRVNAFKHGMAGRGDVLGPDEDARLVAERAATFARELGAVGGTGQVLAHRAAVLSVRMERLADDELRAVAAAERGALAEFDADRRAAIDELMAEVEAEDPAADPAEALAALADCPDGLARLIAAWRELDAQLHSADPGDAVERAARWLGGEVAATAVDLLNRVAAERARLADLALRQGPDVRLLDQARREAGRQARARPTPELILARRYEAAAERGMFRAIRAIAEINRHRAPVEPAAGLADLTSRGAVPDDPPARRPSPPTARSAGPVGSSRPAPAEPLGSFRAGVVPAPRPVGAGRPEASIAVAAGVAGPIPRPAAPPVVPTGR